MSALTVDMEQSLAAVLAEHERGMLARAVVIAELLDDEGERSLSVLTTPGMPEWDALGLCRYGALSIEGPTAAFFTEAGE
ncbi:hypothetical protein GCM10022403_079700 [Streptomyces coacervatus]|uniref:Uncharacterized protein n=1 Tax=Streptomyces coacervatus TaxID=647381 RepID=A0ABP7J4Z1_9ACTN|nr:hypothetical protein [Streptomyces coacervatus]MDF2269356.1 hypothetical protein [Streptomyces coacervatus]